MTAGPDRGPGWFRRHSLALVTAVIVALVIALIVVLIARRRAAPGAPEGGVAAVVVAGTGVSQVKSFVVTLAAIGVVAPRPGHAAEVAAPAATRVTRVLVAVGDRVHAGQALVELDVTVWAAQERQAAAALTAARQAAARAARLVAEGILARKELEAATAQLAAARTAYELAQRTLSLGTLRSPIAGVVTTVLAVVSKPADTSQPLVEVIDPTGLEVLFHLSPVDAARIPRGAPVRLTSEQDSVARLLGTGTVRGTSAAVDSTGSVEVRAAIAHPARALKVGETVSGRIVVAVHRSAVVVPIDALVPSDTGLQVFTVDAHGIAHATPVTAGERTETEVEILSGLHGGERIVTNGAYGVTDGARIQRAPTR